MEHRKYGCKGIYLTHWGNAAYVSGPKAKTAWDLDMAERIPIDCVNLHKFIRPATPSDTAQGPR